jgi:hypothetical protein
MSHGWNNDKRDAQGLYDRFFASVSAVLPKHASLGIKAEQLGVVGVFWPSKKFADRDLIPGNAAGFSDLEDAADGAIDNSLDQLEALIDDPAASQALEAARAQKQNLDNPAVQESFVDLLKSVLPRREPFEVDMVEGAHEFLAANGQQMFANLNRPLLDFAAHSGDEGHAASFDPDLFRSADGSGEAAGLGDILGGIKGAALQILNFTTFYVMKERAATVGHGALNSALAEIQKQAPAIRLHLIGHSFGARAITSATQGPQVLKIASMTLLEAAFSHYAFSQGYDDDPQHIGYFRDVITSGRVRGPILISHSKRDVPVSIAYAIVSRISNTVASALGDATDPYGGLGANGAQKTNEAHDLTLLEETDKYAFSSGAIFNLNGDTIIQNHSDIAEPQVAYALLSALAFTAGLASANARGTAG